MVRMLAVAFAVIGAAIFFLSPSARAGRSRVSALLGRIRRMPARGAATSAQGALATDGDATLAERVRDEVRRDPRVSPDDIQVSAQSGVVTLRGEVDGWADLSDVESRVRRVAGVVRVENLLHLADPRGSAG